MYEQYPFKIVFRSIYNMGKAFGFLSENAYAVSDFSSCRDYLGDIAFRTIHPSDIDFLQFYPKLHVPSFSQMRMVFINNSPNFSETLDNIENVLHMVECKLRMKNFTKIFLYPKHEKCIVLIADPAWMIAPPMISLYTLLIRSASRFKKCKNWEDMLLGDNLESNVVINLKMINGIGRIIDEGWESVFDKDLYKNYPKKGMHNSHTHFGIGAFSSGMSKDYCPHWYGR